MVSVIGRGAYSIPQASRLLRLNPTMRDLVTPAGIRRWAYGYHRRGTSYKSAIPSEQFSRHTGTLSFLELVEVMFIASSLASGLTWPKVREAAQVAAKVLANEPHPFAHRKWFADPAGLYLKLGTESGEEILLEMAGDAQIAMEDLLKVYLKQIRFNHVSGLADGWFPLGPDVPVMVDPLYSFGLPTVNTGVRTDILAGHYRGGDPVEQIAFWYAVPEHEVEAAIEFEEKLQPLAA
ncbi:hypothetical protein BH24GEM1_BH24GEM1_02520 [soil metagenome]